MRSSGGRRSSGRRPGPSRTRDAILDAAAVLFAELGYDRATMRAVAAAAAVDQRLVRHYFSSKRALFVESVRLPVNPADLVRELLEGGPGELEVRLEALLTGLLDHPGLRDRLTSLARAVATDPEIARMVREFLAREVLPRARAALAADRADLRLTLVGSQIIGLVMMRHIIQAEPLASMPAAELAKEVAPALGRYLLEAL